jgi:hypothetical protein
MKKKCTIILFFTLTAYFCFAQGNERWDTGKAETIKRAYIARELNLSPEEATQFWPQYNSYTKEIRQARQQYADDEVAFEEKVVEIRKRYRPNFQKILGNDPLRLNKFYTAEKSYRDRLRNELVKRQQLNKASAPGTRKPIQRKAPRIIKIKPPR